MKIPRNWIGLGILLSGIIFSLYLLSLVPDEVYFNGDGGLKALLAQQLSTGNFRFDLIPPSESWIKQLWSQDFYPYQEPFVYNINNKYYITFPYVFSLITAPFYALFGYGGFYIIPLAATWLIWVLFYFACQQLKFNYFHTNLALVILIFSSYLTPYSAMYWEHSLAVALCFAGLFIIFFLNKNHNLSVQLISLGGCLVGLSAWVRSEFLSMVATLVFLWSFIYILKVYYSKIISKHIDINPLFFTSNKSLVFIISMLTTVGLFFVSNKVIYDRFLGIHAMQIVEDFSWIRRLKEAWESFTEINWYFFAYFPVAVFSLLYLFHYLARKISGQINHKWLIFAFLLIITWVGLYYLMTGTEVGLKVFVKQWWLLLLVSSLWLFFMRDIDLELTPKMSLIYLICLLFTIGVALLVDSGADEIAVGGKQWGQRYLLILLPLVSLLVIQQLSYIRKIDTSIPAQFSLIFLVFLMVLGIHKNSYEGTVFFEKSHQKVYPAIQILKENTTNFVVVSHQFVAQQLEPSVQGKKHFFQIDNAEKLVEFSSVLAEHNISNYLYICYPYRKCEVPETIIKKPNYTWNNQPVNLSTYSLNNESKYSIYEVSILRAN